AVATSWAEVVAALEGTRIFRLSTVRADGRPHVCPLPAMWLDGRLFFVTGLEEQKARNLARDPRCVLSTGTDDYRRGL
ncbi:pyridoxamine 5'-phosphate oxidase family protein, partial [Mycobacterium kansasii]